MNGVINDVLITIKLVLHTNPVREFAYYMTGLTCVLTTLLNYIDTFNYQVQFVSCGAINSIRAGSRAIPVYRRTSIKRNPPLRVLQSPRVFGGVRRSESFFKANIKPLSRKGVSLSATAQQTLFTS